MFLLLKTEYHSRGRGGGGHRSPILETKAVGICKQNYPDLPNAVSNSFFFRTGKRGSSLTKYCFQMGRQSRATLNNTST